MLRAVLVVLALMLSPVSRANMNECEERVDLAVTVGLDGKSQVIFRHLLSQFLHADLHNTSTAIDDETFLLLCSSTHDFDHERWYFEDVNGEIILARIANNGSWVETTECPQGELLRGKFATEPVVVWCCADRMVKRRRTERKTTKVPHECVRVSIHVARPSPTRSTQGKNTCVYVQVAVALVKSKHCTEIGVNGHKSKN